MSYSERKEKSRGITYFTKEKYVSLMDNYIRKMECNGTELLIYYFVPLCVVRITGESLVYLQEAILENRILKVVVSGEELRREEYRAAKRIPIVDSIEIKDIGGRDG